MKASLLPLIAALALIGCGEARGAPTGLNVPTPQAVAVAKWLDSPKGRSCAILDYQSPDVVTLQCGGDIFTGLYLQRRGTTWALVAQVSVPGATNGDGPSASQNVINAAIDRRLAKLLPAWLAGTKRRAQEAM